MSHILFLDIETVSVEKSLNDSPDSWREAYINRFKRKIIGDDDVLKYEIETILSTHYNEGAALHAEFGKIVCYSVAYVGQHEGQQVLKVQSVASRHEIELLNSLSKILEKVAVICGHNIREFDLPFLFRRYLINNLPVPSCLKVSGKKPWEIPHIDTMDLWSHMAWKYRCSLDLIAQCLGLPSPKSEMSGSDVGRLYWNMFDGVKGDELPFDKEKEVLDKISNYCAGDTITVANVYNRIEGRPIFTDQQIVRI